LTVTSARIASFAAQIAIALFLVFATMTGAYLAGVSFRDPDICWLLALGKWIIEHGHLPLIDPFSSNISTYVRVGENVPLIQYQWGSQIVFYVIYKFFGGAFALLSSFAAVCALTYFVLQYRLITRNGASLTAFLLIIVGIVAVHQRLVARPEVLSNLLLTTMLTMVIGSRFKDRKGNLIATAVVCPLFAIWVNLHMIFPAAMFILGVHTAAQLVETAIDRYVLLPRGSIDGDVVKRQSWLIVLPFLCALPALLINPWGLNLLLFIAKMTDTDVTTTNVDHQPSVFTSEYGIAYLILAALYLVLIVRLCLKHRWKNVSISGIALYGLACLFAIKYAKLIPFGVLLMAGSYSEFQVRTLAYKLNVEDPDKKTNPINSFITEFNRQLTALTRKNALVWAFFAVLSFQLGVVLLFKYFGEPPMPRATAMLTPPLKAMAFLDERGVGNGRLLNEALIGSVMSWHMKKPPDIFMDARYSFYEPEVIHDFLHMSSAVGPWRQLLDKYKITCIFFPPSSPIIKALAEDKNWKVIYRDDEAVILERTLPASSTSQPQP